MQSSTSGTRVAAAIDRVLEAEHATAAAVASAQAEAQAAIEAARESRRLILEKARDRILHLHEQAQRRIDDTLRTLDAQAATTGADGADLAAVTDAAVARVAARLTSDTPA